MHIQLIQDLKQQKKQLCNFTIKLSAFILLFVIFDRFGAWFLEKGLDRHFGFDTPSQILLIGNSRTALGIDKISLERDLCIPVSKYTRNGANIADRLVMIKQYLDRQPSNVKILIYDVDAHTFTGEGLSLNSYTLFYPFIDSPLINSYIRQHASLTNYITLYLLKLRRFNLETLNLSFRGWLKKWSNLKHGTIDIGRLQKQIANGQIRRISFDDECIRYFEETLNFVTQKDIYVILLYIPTIDLFNQAEPEKYMHAIELLKSYASKNNKVTFLDYTQLFSHQHELFYDPIHLNPQGQQAVTKKLIKDLKTFFVQTKDYAGLSK